MENIIIDTDLGFDCDDGGALIIANKLYSESLINILAITHSVNRAAGVSAINKINEFYGHYKIPTGMAERYALNVDRFYEEFFLKLKYRDGFQGFPFKPSFYRLLNAAFGFDEKTKGTFTSAPSLIKARLEKADDKSVVLLCIGQLNNFADVIREDFSLCKKKLKKAVVMCGNFLQEGDYFYYGDTFWHGEFNVISDVESAKTVFQTDGLDIDVIDFNNGFDILTGSGLSGQETNPVYKMYKLHGNGGECPSWDPIATLFASGLYDECFNVSDYGKIDVSDKGKTTFSVGGGSHRLISVKPDKKAVVRDIINEIYKK